MHFRELDFLQDPVPRAAPWNMAADEVLLLRSGGRRPLLRVYSWREPSVSLGYFEKFEPVEACCLPEFVPVRRWTGGGLVLHGEDVTYSLIVPAEAPEARLAAAAFYGFVHGRLCAVLAESGLAATLSESCPGAAREGISECFRNPVRCDVMVEGRKVAGAGQKRTRRGLLHQGSIQGLALPSDFGRRFAAALSGNVFDSSGILAGRDGEIERLVAEKYGTEAWLRRF